MFFYSVPRTCAWIYREWREYTAQVASAAGVYFVGLSFGLIRVCHRDQTSDRNDDGSVLLLKVWLQCESLPELPDPRKLINTLTQCEPPSCPGPRLFAPFRFTHVCNSRCELRHER